jgi:hypothetical protein
MFSMGISGLLVFQMRPSPVKVPLISQKRARKSEPAIGAGENSSDVRRAHDTDANGSWGLVLVGQVGRPAGADQAAGR